MNKYILYLSWSGWGDGLSPIATSNSIDDLKTIAKLFILGETRRIGLIYSYNNHIYEFANQIKEKPIKVMDELFNELNLKKTYQRFHHKTKNKFAGNYYNTAKYLDDKLWDIFKKWLLNFYYLNNTYPTSVQIYRKVKEILPKPLTYNKHF